MAREDFTSVVDYIKDVLHYSIFSKDNQYTEYDIKADFKGIYLIPIYPISYQITEDLYDRIFTVLNLALTPEFTLIKPLTIQIVTFKNQSRNTSRALYFPWRIGSASRLEGSFEDMFQRYQKTGRIPIMDIIDVNFRKSPHLIVSGVSGAGKSFFLRYMLQMVSQMGQVLLIDPKCSDAARWAKNRKDVHSVLPEYIVDQRGVESGIGTTYIQQVNKQLKKVEAVMFQRQAAIYKKANHVSADFTDLEYEPIFVVADEVAALMAGATKSLRDEFQQALTEITLLGRESGVFLILSLQAARAEFIPTIVRDNVAVRLQLGRINSENTRFLFPELSEMPMIPVSGKGRGIISIAGDDRYAGIEPVATPTIIERRNASVK